MLHFFKFRQDCFDPAPARDVYTKRPAGRGWPEECPPIRAANSFGYDVLANFDVTFVKGRNGWRVEPDVILESDFNWSNDDESEGASLRQQYAWFWDRGQTLPHKITDDVYDVIKNQVKLSSFLYLKSDPNEILLMTEVPNQVRPFKAMSAIVDTDWFPASYPWHAVLELDPAAKRVEIKKGDAVCRILPVRRDTYFAKQMTPGEFDDFFARGQDWLAAHGRMHEGAEGGHHLDITHTYVKQQIKSRFVVIK